MGNSFILLRVQPAAALSCFLGGAMAFDSGCGLKTEDRDNQRSTHSAEMSLDRRNRQLEALHSVAKTLNASLSLEEVLHQALDQALELFEFPSGAIRLLEAATGELTLVAHSGLAPEVRAELAGTVRLG